MTGAIDNDSDVENGNFLCGVVEGFYGRPWTTTQRKDLFQKMHKFGLNTFLYAPKDDYKHRAYWRELYSVEEADHLTSLIEAAHANDVTFVYAISPGIDVTFSSTKDVSYLKRKLDQVSRFGCKAFAILFDDIEPEMCAADKEIFQSFAHAQVSVTNEIFQHLSQPTFLFCPTEYCATRAVPTVPASEYLNTIGSKLLPGIDIMWTGNKVIAKAITLDQIKTISDVLRRPPVIWDNIHANDYDQKRLFLGPYEGRATEIIPHLKGVLTNPNCEYHCNFIAMHTLAQWSKSYSGPEPRSPSPVSSDIKLETEDDTTFDHTSSSYRPKHALKLAIQDWMDEFYTKRELQTTPTSVTNVTTLPAELTQVTTCMGVNTNSIIPPTGIIPPLSDNVPPVLNALASEMVNAPPYDHLVADSMMQPTMNPVNNSLTGAKDEEPMECSNKDSRDDLVDKESERMQVDSENGTDKEDESTAKSEMLTFEDVAMLVDLFYLPYEHGERALVFLNEFHWMKTNAHLVNKTALPDDSESQEWRTRAEAFHQSVRKVSQSVDLMFKIPNRGLLYDLYPYVWDMRGILSLLNSYVKWLESGHIPYVSVCYLRRAITWCTHGFKEAFMSGDQEPWVFRGGLQADFQRMLPLENASDLFAVRPPDEPQIEAYTIRPYLPGDQAAVYDLCRQINRTCSPAGNPQHNDVIADKLVGGLLSYTPQYCFVLEDCHGLVGYALASLDSKSFHCQMETVYDVEMKEKYPKPEKTDKTLSPEEEVILGFYEERRPVCENLYRKYPSLVKMDLLVPRLRDVSVIRRLLACLLSALKSNGSHGVHAHVNAQHADVIDVYVKHGFIDVTSLFEAAPPEGVVFLGRIM